MGCLFTSCFSGFSSHYNLANGMHESGPSGPGVVNPCHLPVKSSKVSPASVILAILLIMRIQKKNLLQKALTVSYHSNDNSNL